MSGPFLLLYHRLPPLLCSPALLSSFTYSPPPLPPPLSSPPLSSLPLRSLPFYTFKLTLTRDISPRLFPDSGHCNAEHDIKAAKPFLSSEGDESATDKTFILLLIRELKKVVLMFPVARWGSVSVSRARRSMEGRRGCINVATSHSAAAESSPHPSQPIQDDTVLALLEARWGNEEEGGICTVLWASEAICRTSCYVYSFGFPSPPPPPATGASLPTTLPSLLPPSAADAIPSSTSLPQPTGLPSISSRSKRSMQIGSGASPISFTTNSIISERQERGADEITGARSAKNLHASECPQSVKDEYDARLKKKQST
ncbi:hypothetical protein BDQ17DRAFT_1431915 [Cyathus striatus]|nr:hypothetical protein BDQ17DRAFT_1431915 [Cyathus striatus]